LFGLAWFCFNKEGKENMLIKKEKKKNKQQPPTTNATTTAKLCLKKK